MKQKIPVVDLFAGPGGLNEGFSRFDNLDGKSPLFRTCLSVEMDSKAHLTLQLRAMYRELLETGQDTSKYWQYVKVADERARNHRGRPSPEMKRLRAELEKQLPRAVSEAPETLQLGKQNQKINDYLSGRLTNDTPWVLLGGPPCQAYSRAGASRMKNVDPEKFAKDHRHKLYQEYLRVVARWRPSVFVMENVKGILSSEHGKELTIEGAIVHQIIADLERPAKAVERIDPDYAEVCHDEQYDLYSFVAPPDWTGIEPSKLTIYSENYGIPQARHRVIILGVLKTKKSSNWQWRPIGNGPVHVQDKVTVKEAIGDLPTLHGGITNRQPIPEWKGAVDLPDWKRAVEGYIRPLVTGATKNQPHIDPKFATKLRSNLAQLRQFKPESLDAYARSRSSRISNWQRKKSISAWYKFSQSYQRGNLDSPLNHYCKDHQASDLARYFFVSSASSMEGNEKFRVKDFPLPLLPNHEKAKDDDPAFSDCFTSVDPDQPSLTIMSHLKKDGHYYIHYDPTQTRCISVREAARLQTFPDDYFFEGPKSEQYHQVGNAVPPMLATQLADVVHEIISQCFWDE